MKTKIVILALLLFTVPSFVSAGICDYTKGKITSVTPATVSYGGILTINGSGFGTRSLLHTDSSTTYDRRVEVVFDYLGNASSRGSVRDFGGGSSDYEDQPKNSKVLSWSDSKIEVKILDDFESGFQRVVNGSVTGQKFPIDTKLGTLITKFNYRQKSVSNGVPIYELTPGNEGYEICADPFYGQTFTYTPSCSADIWACSDWSACSVNGAQTRLCSMTSDCPFADTPSPSISQSCTYVPPICISWTYSAWGSCSVDGEQTRDIISSSPGGCAGGNPTLSQSCTYVPPTCTTWTYSDWGQCSASEQQTRTIISSSPNGCVGGSPILSQSCTCSSWTYSNWSACSETGQQTRTIASSSPSGCIGGSPTLSQSCTYTPLCTANSWQCGDWNNCSVDGKQTRTCTKKNVCDGGVVSPSTTQSCTYVAPVCSSWTYSGWSACSETGQQTRTITTSLPNGCAGGSPNLQQSCTPACSADTWTCGDWNQCSTSGTQSRSCTKSFDCPTASTPSPTTSQNCTPPQPACNADTWTCGVWDTCSLSGIQNRSCNKTFDCPSVETAPPTMAQYCEAPNRPTQQIPQDSSDEILNQDTIVKSTVKLLCPVDARMASQGSGTVIDPSGTILTNKHVIAGTLGCLVGFINEFNDEPYFGERQIADIVKVSPNQDLAILKIRNPQNRSLASIDMKRGNSNPRLGTRVVTYGYPAKFGKKLTYTSGDFSGTDGSYIKTTAILEHGNSGGGAYLKDGTFIGVPSAVVRGELNALGYILSVGAVNAWLGNSTLSLGSGSNNQYSRVSVLEDIDLQHLDSLKLFIPETDKIGALAKPVTPVVPVAIPSAPKVIERSKIDKDTPKHAEKIEPSKSQEESVVIESADDKGEGANQQKRVELEKEQKPKRSLPKRFFSWLAGLFSRLAR